MNYFTVFPAMQPGRFFTRNVYKYTMCIVINVKGFLELYLNGTKSHVDTYSYIGSVKCMKTSQCKIPRP